MVGDACQKASFYCICCHGVAVMSGFQSHMHVLFEFVCEYVSVSSVSMYLDKYQEETREKCHGQGRYYCIRACNA